jgi:CDP-4-dehydro-6-deoxyglucose reductase, E1|tara:strand:+ start:1699 stop:2853 length:1155 start_codon:yes stop_codon:yes gene_type:complete
MKPIKLVSDTIDDSDIKRLIMWLETNPKLTKGDLTVQLEKEWAEKMGTKYSVFVNSGSSAILLMVAALKEFNHLKNKKIVVSSLSWATDVSTPMLLDLDTILVDCNLTDLSADLTHLEDIFIKESPSVFISVAPLGFVPNMTELVSLCEKYDVILLEDICESMGSKHNNKYLGSYGFASVFSLYFGHHISTIEGGFINTNDEDYYHELLMMRSHGWDRDLPKWKQKELREKYEVSEFESFYTFYVPGMNLRSTDLQAFIGLGAINKLDGVSEIRLENLKIYLSEIPDNGLNLEIRECDFISNFAYPMIHKNRNEIVKELTDIGVEVRPLIAGNMGRKPFWVDKYGVTELTNADLIHTNGFYLPNHQDITIDDIKIISNIIKKYE